MKLGTLLLRNAAIGLAQLEAALRNQVLYGGKLGTNLVELGFLDLDQLTEYLSELSGVPALTTAMIDGASAEIAAKIDGEMAVELGAVPLFMVDGGCAVAMVEPRDRFALERLHGLVGPIRPHVTPELRLLYCIEKLYGVSRKARFVRIAPRRPAEVVDVDADTDANADRRRSQPAGGLVLPRPVTVEPRRKRQTSLQPVAPAMVSRSMTLEQAAAHIEHATRREQIAEAFIEFAHGRCAAMAVLLVRDGNALG